MHDESSYRIIAPYYDWIMSHVDYDRWGRHVRRLARLHGLSDPGLVLEIAAGTCPFARRKVFAPETRIVYTDLSAPMLRAGRTEALRQPAGYTARPLGFAAANAIALPFRPGFDLVLMIYDSFNYLVLEEEAKKTLAEARRLLKPGGLLLFDITTEANSRRHFRQNTYYEEGPACAYVRESWYDEEAQLQHNDFTYYVEGPKGSFRRRQENHLQRVYPLALVKEWIEVSGLFLLGSYDNFTLKDAKGRSERVHLVAGRSPASPPVPPLPVSPGPPGSGI